MHPFLRSPAASLTYFGTATLLATLLSLAVAREGSFELGDAWLVVTPGLLLFSFVGLGSWYACRSLPLSRDQSVKIAGTHLFAAAVAALAFTFGISAAADALYPAPKPGLERTLFAASALIYLLMVTVNYLLIQVDASREAQERALRLGVAAREAEIQAFRSQINPHFLFNSLNSISSLCGSNPAGARRMTEQLAGFFRTTVRAGSRELVQLRDEIELIEQYLAIEAIRFGERLETRMSIDSSTVDCLVPPLTLQPLVENAIRHGIAHRLDGGRVQITSKLYDDLMTIRVINDTDPDRVVKPGEGIGINNVRERLRQTFEGRSSVHVEEQGETFTVTLRLPVRREGDANV